MKKEQTFLEGFELGTMAIGNNIDSLTATIKKKSPKKIEPGQVWLSDKHYKYNRGYSGEVACVISSKEPGNDWWICHCFQSWDAGAFERRLTAKEIKLMKYIGHIGDLRK